MRLEHDPAVKMAYLQLVEVLPGQVKETVVVDDPDLPGELAVDLDAEGRILDIKVFDARRALDPTLLGEAES